MNPATRVVDRPGVSTEAHAIAVLRNGDGQGFETLARLHQLRATRTAFGITWQREAAQHAVAEAPPRSTSVSASPVPSGPSRHSSPASWSTNLCAQSAGALRRAGGPEVGAVLERIRRRTGVRRQRLRRASDGVCCLPRSPSSNRVIEP